MRGARAEGITLAGVIAGTVIFTNESSRSRIVSLVNKLPRLVDVLLGPEDTAIVMSTAGGPRLLGGPEEQLLFYVGFFSMVVIISLVAGSALGGGPTALSQRFSGAIMGAVSGFASTLAFTNFSQNYLILHPDFQRARLELPQLIAPTLPSSHPLAPYTSLIFMGAFFAIAALTLAVITKSKGH